MDIQNFKQMTSEAVQWFSRQPNGENEQIISHLWSGELNPHEEMDGSKRAFALVEKVTQRRSELLRHSQRGGCQEPIGKGRFVIFFPEYNLLCGAAEVYSAGYFSESNCPPWAMWIGCGQSGKIDSPRDAGGNYALDRGALYLIAWVPEPLIALAGRGIEANPEECIAWLDECDTPFTIRLKDEGLI